MQPHRISPASWTLQATALKAGAALNGPGDFEKTARSRRPRALLAEYHALRGPDREEAEARTARAAWGDARRCSSAAATVVEFIQRPEQLTIIYETHNEVRARICRGIVLAIFLIHSRVSKLKLMLLVTLTGLMEVVSAIVGYFAASYIQGFNRLWAGFRFRSDVIHRLQKSLSRDAWAWP